MSLRQRDFAENLIEEVKLIDEFENEEKFGKDKMAKFMHHDDKPEKQNCNNDWPCFAPNGRDCR